MELGASLRVGLSACIQHLHQLFSKVVTCLRLSRSLRVALLHKLLAILHIAAIPRAAPFYKFDELHY